MLVELELPSFNTVLHNVAASFNSRLGCSANRLVMPQPTAAQPANGDFGLAVLFKLLYMISHPINY